MPSTFAPIAVQIRAVSSPIPDADPVTTIVLPFSKGARSQLISKHRREGAPATIQRDPARFAERFHRPFAPVISDA